MYEIGELRATYDCIIRKLPTENTLHVYCDRSVARDGKAGCGVLIKEYTDIGTVDTVIGCRLTDNVSSTQAELQGVLAGLQEVVKCGKNACFFIDSRGALESLNSRRPVYQNIVIECRENVKKLEKTGYKVRFMWIPSHVGILLNEVVDDIAKRATEKTLVDVVCQLTLKQIKTRIKMIQEGEEMIKRMAMVDSSNTLKNYAIINTNSSFTYGKGKSTWKDSIYIRLRLGYKYIWQYGVDVSEKDKECKLCSMPHAHTLEHYVLECQLIENYRNKEINSVPHQIVWMCDNGMKDSILRSYKNFAPRV
ncbi:uncharacterized protein [Procambarus clarkii]|uniref:uncharacterized protein n=1 Tax=Procambarus clarkii TaxID=6728 RepID=UPI0037427EC5